MTDEKVIDPTPEEIEASRPEPSTPIYGVPGGEGIRDVPRRLVAFVELPDRRTETWQARNMLRESDIREAMAKGARRLFDQWTQKFSVLGFKFDPEDIEYDITRLEMGMDVGAETAIPHTEGLARVLVATVVIRRG